MYLISTDREWFIKWKERKGLQVVKMYMYLYTYSAYT